MAPSGTWPTGGVRYFRICLTSPCLKGQSTDWKEGRYGPPDGSKVLSQTGLERSNPGRFIGQGFPAMTISGLTALS
jgi:hypothetical protein